MAFAAKAVAHGVVGGVSSLAQGGGFLGGFAAGGVAQFVGGGRWTRRLDRTGQGVVRIVAGGLASLAGGGKFKNGAMTAAYAYAFNELRHRYEQDQKAVEALSKANPLSIKNNLEYGGHIYRNVDGTYGYTSPLAGTAQGFNPSSALHLVPEDAIIVGDYHTHADYSLIDPQTGAVIRTGDPARDAFNSDHYSYSDYRGIAADAAGNPNYRGYLGTPSGTFKAYDPVGNREYEIY